MAYLLGLHAWLREILSIILLELLQRLELAMPVHLNFRGSSMCICRRRRLQVDYSLPHLGNFMHIEMMQSTLCHLDCLAFTSAELSRKGLNLPSSVWSMHKYRRNGPQGQWSKISGDLTLDQT
jgi:hypothetical protein